MIKNYKQYNEGMKHLLVGPTEEEIWDNIKDSKPSELLIKSVQSGIIKGVIISLDELEKYESYPNMKFKIELVVVSSAKYGHYDIVKLLLDRYKGTITKKCCNDALNWAIQNNHVDIQELLREFIKTNY